MLWFFWNMKSKCYVKRWVGLGRWAAYHQILTPVYRNVFHFLLLFILCRFWFWDELVWLYHLDNFLYCMWFTETAILTSFFFFYIVRIGESCFNGKFGRSIKWYSSQTCFFKLLLREVYNIYIWQCGTVCVSFRYKLSFYYLYKHTSKWTVLCCAFWMFVFIINNCMKLTIF